jgi:hypothetical protein
MRGLDPRIHLLTKMMMDGRVKPGHDDGVVNVTGEYSRNSMVLVRLWI